MRIDLTPRSSNLSRCGRRLHRTSPNLGQALRCVDPLLLHPLCSLIAKRKPKRKPNQTNQLANSTQTHLRDKESIEAELAQAKEEAQKIEEQIRPWQEKFDEKRQEIEQLAHASQKIAKKLQSVHEKITTVCLCVFLAIGLC